MDKGFHFDRATRLPGSDLATFVPLVAVRHCQRNETCAFGMALALIQRIMRCLSMS